jgi:hypothetical protein
LGVTGSFEDDSRMAQKQTAASANPATTSTM